MSERRSSAVSAEPVAWAILGSNSASGIWKILQDKASADYWATRGFQVQPLGYLNRPASRAQPQSAPTKITDQDLRRRWREAGGEFYGPHVETGSMPEAKLLPFLRSLLNQSPHCQAESAEAIEAEQDERRRVFGPFSWDEPQAESAK